MKKFSEILESIRKEVPVREVFQSLLATGLALAAGGIIILISGYDPIFAYITLFRGAFGSVYSLCGTLARATPIIFTGLAMTVAFLVNAANLGAEGQLYLGAFFAFLCGYLISVPAPLHVPLALLMGALGGVLWAALPALLKVKRGVHEIVTTMMMNGIAVLLTDYLTMHQFLDPAALILGATPFIYETAVLPRIVHGTSLSASFIIGLICVIGVYYLLKRTSLGYEIRVVGLNPKAAEYGGISVSKVWLLGMLMSGALAGLAGAGVTMGTYRRFLVRFSTGYGLPDGIVVALIGRRNPIGVVLAGIFIGALYTGSIYMRLATHIPKELVLAMMGIIIVFVAIPEIWRIIKR